MNVFQMYSYAVNITWKNNVWQILGPTATGACALHTLLTLLLRHWFEQCWAREDNPMGGVGGVYGGKDFWKRKVLSLEWNTVGVIDGDNGDAGRDEFRWLWSSFFRYVKLLLN